MLIKSTDKLSEVKRDFRGGEGEIFINYFFKEDRDKGAIKAMHVLIPPGSSVGYHQHLGDEEIYFILKGRGEVNDNGEIKEVEPGDLVITRSGESHGVKCISDEPLEIIAIINKV
ncbi:MAG: cupin domain-containing protein [Synergistetes bacterium]|nr:cupin domain-containing protein [Synergistota bacterium]